MMTKKFELNSVVVDLEAMKLKGPEDEKYVKVKTKSEMFRQLYDRGLEVAEIARETDSHYSFVYGVISSSREMRKSTKVTKSDMIRDLADEGMTPGEIAKQLNSNYSFVHSVVSKHKTEKEVAQ